VFWDQTPYLCQEVFHAAIYINLPKSYQDFL
jgi:hypothetical protein